MVIEYRLMKMHNFMSYKDEKFDWSLNKGMTLITGINKDIPGVKNGCGKSTLFNALEYALYGELSTNIKNENIKNMFVKSDDSYVDLTFCVDGDLYRVISGLSGIKKVSSYVRLYKIDNDGNEENITKSSIAETRNYMVKNLLHQDQSSFMRTTLLNTDPKYNFYNMTPATGKEFLEGVFNLDYFGNLCSAVKTIENRIKNDIANENGRLNDALSLKDTYTEQNETFENKKIKDLESFTVSYNLAKEKYDSCLKEFKEIDYSSIESLSNEREKVLNEIMSLKDRIGDIISQYKVDSQTILSNKTLISDKTKSIKKVTNITSKLCDSCSKILTTRFKTNEMNKDIEKVSNANKELTEKIKEAKVLVNNLNTEMKNKKEEYTQLTSKISSIQNLYNNKKSELVSLKNELINSKNNIDHVTNRTNTISSLIEQNNSHIEELKSNISELTRRLYAAKMAKALSSSDGAEKKIMSNIVNVLNTDISNNLKQLGVNYGVVITDDMNYHFKNEAIGSRPQYRNFSSGEQARISIGTSLTIKKFMAERSGIISNVMMIDEYIDGNVDEIAINNMLKLLKKQAEQNHQNIYVISHRSEVQNSVFDNIIEITKENNISTIRRV